VRADPSPPGARRSTRDRSGLPAGADPRRQRHAVCQSGTDQLHGPARRPASLPRQGTPPDERRSGPSAPPHVQRTYYCGYPTRPAGDLAGGDCGATLPDLCAVLGEPGAARRRARRSDFYHRGDPGPPPYRTLGAQHIAAAPWGALTGVVPRPLARGGAAPVGQADAGGRAAMRLRPHQSAAPPSIGAAGREHLSAYRRHAARPADRLLGSDSPPDSWSAAPGAGPGPFSRLARAAPATSQKTVTHCALAHRRLRASPTEAASAHAL
jgi:hypothetical protein